ncbi:MAG: hypothetical protein GF418_14725, partial [Chitinivibrionales bacterium]|nr:hypothetical protein [Chitinivibrionales bacterium]MBD3396874.1 hypothetical protein [Chitinivibrionales bacterium]
ARRFASTFVTDRTISIDAPDTVSRLMSRPETVKTGPNSAKASFTNGMFSSATILIGTTRFPVFRTGGTPRCRRNVRRYRDRGRRMCCAKIPDPKPSQYYILVEFSLASTHTVRVSRPPLRVVTMTKTDKLSASLYASIAGDALGVPVEHSTRQELALTSVKNMLGYGRYDQPEGTWSDDSSMILCTMESLCKGYNLDDIGKTFCSWLFESRWTASGYVFDSGLTTFVALESIRSDQKNARESGGGGPDDNGNGSLMRILPAALYFSNEDTPGMLEKIHEVSAITHAHPRAKAGCGIYALIVRALLESADKAEALARALEEAREYYKSDPAFQPEMKHYERLLAARIPGLDAAEIQSSGYVVHTLEAAVWCLFKASDTKSILLEAVNLGLDTDTTGTVAGGLAGLAHGLEGVPAVWLSSLARKDEIDALITQFVNCVSSRPGGKALR